MSIYAISDLHLSFNSQKPMDIFPGWEDYTEKLKKNWMKLVSDGDTVVIAGDISWSLKADDSKYDLDWIDALPGRKIISKAQEEGSYISFIFKDNTSLTITNDTEVIYAQFHMYVRTVIDIIWIDYSNIANIEII